MRFVKEQVDLKPIVDTVFAIVKKAKEAKQEIGEENVVDATIGSLYDEHGKIVAFDSVFSTLGRVAATCDKVSAQQISTVALSVFTFHGFVVMC